MPHSPPSCSEYLAQQLDDYLRFRCNRENVDYRLDPDFFADWLGKGTREFFGVCIDAWQIDSDSQNPAALEAWRGQPRPINTKSLSS